MMEKSIGISRAALAEVECPHEIATCPRDSCARRAMSLALKASASTGAAHGSQDIGLDLLHVMTYIAHMPWTVLFQEDFAAEFATFDEDARVEMRAMAGHLAMFGPGAKRPQVDTLKGTKIANLKEFRFNAANGVWRVAFAFDAKRRAIILAAGDKSGTSSDAFYKRLIKTAERRMAKFETAQEEEEE